MNSPNRSKTRCLLVRPEFPGQTFYSMEDVCRLYGAKASAPPLGLLSVAALLPDSWELMLVDGAVEPITAEHLHWADLVMVTALAPHRDSALRVVRQAHQAGKRVVIGGPGPTMHPEPYAEADYLVVGDAEVSVPRLLVDLEAGLPSGRYGSAERSDLTTHPVPRYDLLRLADYVFVCMQFTRGCPFSCEFCSQVGEWGARPSSKRPEQILAEFQLLYDLGYRGIIDFGYDNLIGNRARTIETLTAMRDWQRAHGYPFCFGTEATVNLTEQTDVLELMRENDFRFVFFGIESPDETVLETAHKDHNTTVSAVEAARIFNAHGLLVYGSLILGFDGETEQTVGNMIDLVQRSGVFPTLIMPLHAFPKTGLHARLEREGRLFVGSDDRLDPADTCNLAVTGLNFVTTRSRVQILRDLVRLLTEVYSAKNHGERVALTVAQLATAYKQKPGLLRRAELLVRVVRLILSRSLRGGGFRWLRTLLGAVVTNPRALEAVITLEVMQASQADQAEIYVRVLERQIQAVEAVGEEQFEAEMLEAPGGRATTVAC